MPKMTRICRFENRYLRCNSPAIYPQNRFSSVPTFCYPGVAFCSKTAILVPGSGAESGVIYDPDSRFGAQICGGKMKKARWNSSGLTQQMVEQFEKERTIAASTQLFCLSRAQNSSIKQKSALIGLGPFEHKKGALHNKLDFTSPNCQLNDVFIGFVELSSRVF